jgi:hypothetical protein
VTGGKSGGLKAGEEFTVGFTEFTVLTADEELLAVLVPPVCCRARMVRMTQYTTSTGATTNASNPASSCPPTSTAAESIMYCREAAHEIRASHACRRTFRPSTSAMDTPAAAPKPCAS